MIRPFLFGKLPAFDDFIARGMSPPMHRWWEEYCTRVERANMGAETRGGLQEATVARGFLIPPRSQSGLWQAGCIAPSYDKTGCSFPFVAGISSATPLAEDSVSALGNELAETVGPYLDRFRDVDELLDLVRATAQRNLPGH